MECLLSVVLTVYNVEKYITKSLDCLANQIYNDFQLIIIDDGSKDESLKLIEASKERFKDILIVSQKNCGVSAARNKGMSFAKGKYIIFLDSDDLYEPNMLNTLLNIAKDSDADITACGYLVLEENNNKPVKSDVYEGINEIPSDIQLKEFLTHRKIDGYVWNKMFKLDFLKTNNIKFIEGKIYEDTIMIFDVLLNRPRYVYTNKKLYNYIKRKGSITTLSDDKSVDKLYENAELVENRLKSLNLLEILKEECDYFQKLIYMQVLIQINLSKMKKNSKNTETLEKSIFRKLSYNNNYLTLRDKIYIFILKNNLFKVYYNLFKSRR